MPRQQFDFGAESGEDTGLSTAVLESRLKSIESQITSTKDHNEISDLTKDAAWILLDLKLNKLCWQRARPLFDHYFIQKNWAQLIDLCELLFLSEQPQSLSALGQGVWLAVTFPVDPKITISMLQYVIDETTDDSDGAAVAAATALYVYNLRQEDTDNADLYLEAMQMLTSVGRRHANAHDQKAFDAWFERMELNQPEKFLVRMRNVIDVLVQDEWWFNREKVQDNLPN